MAMVILIALLPIGASASGVQNSEREALLALAYSVFPEYEDMQESTTASSLGPRAADGTNEVVFTETRSASENVDVTYVQYASGEGIFITNTASFTGSVTDEEYVDSANSSTGTATIKVVCSGDSSYGGVFTLKDFKFTIHESGYDVIQSRGTASFNSSSYGSAKLSGTTKYQEDSNGPANFTYGLTFYANGSSSYGKLSVSFSVKVGSNRVSIVLN